MKEITDLTDPLLAKLQTPSTEPAPNVAKFPNPAASLRENSPEYASSVMERLWLRMTEAYGGAWARQYGLVSEGGYETWKRALLDLTAVQIGRGFDEAIQHHQDFPPNLAQFIALCQPPPACHQRYQPLPKPPMDRTKAEPHLRALRQRLSGALDPAEQPDDQP